MTDYRIVVEIDPAKSKQGGDAVEQKLRAIEKAADRLKAVLDRALDFSTAGEGQRSLTDMAASANELANATTKVAASANTTAQAEKTLETNTQRTSRAFTEMAASIRDAETALKAEYKASVDAAKGATQVAASAKAQAVAQQDLNSHVLAWREHTAKAAKANDNLTTSGRKTTQMLGQMSFQLNDVVTGLASGQSAFQILAQQGGQVFQVLQMGPGGVGGSLRALAGLIGPTVVLVASLATVFGVLVGSFLSGNKEAAKLNNTLAITGNFAGITAKQFDDMAVSVSRATDTSIGNARKVLMELASTGKFTGETMRFLAEDIVKLSQYTGRSADEFVALFSKMGDKVSDFASNFNSQYHILTAAQYEHIRLLEEQGRTTEAQLSLAKAVHEDLGKVGPENLGYLERAWRGVTNAISSAIDALKSFGRAQGTAGLQQELSKVQEQLGSKAIGNQLAPVRQELLKREAELKTKIAAADEKSAKALAQTEGVGAAERLSTKWGDMADNTARARREVQAYEADIAKLKKANPGSALLPSAQQIKETKEAIMKRYTPNATKAENKAESAARAAARRAEQLAREAQAVEATTAATLELAKAYGVSDVAALKAQASTEAVGKAITKKGDIDAFVARQLEANAAKAAAAGAKELSDITFKTTALKAANSAVAAGTTTQAEANEQMQLEAALRPLIAQATAAESDAKKVLLGVIAGLRKSTKEYNAELDRSQTLAGTRAANDNIQMMEREVSLLTATNLERAKSIAQLQAEQELKQRGQSTADPDGKAFVQSRIAAAAAQVKLNEATFNYNMGLDYQVDALSRIDAIASQMATGLTSSFGRIGSAVGKLITTLTAYDRKQAEIARAQKAYTDQGGNDARRLAAFSKDARDAEIQHYGDMLSASKEFFSEKSAAYKVLEGAEKAYRLFEFAMAVKSIFFKTAETAATVTSETTQTTAVVAGSTARASAKAAEGIAGIFAALGPWAFPVAAAAVAFMVGVGVKGLSGGGSQKGVTDAEDRQKAQGAGSVLGDPTAKSESIQRALDAVSKNTNKELEYSNGMLKALRSIDTQISSLAALIARQLQIPGGAFDTSDLNLGTTRQGPGTFTKIANPFSVLLPGLFGTTKKTTLQDQGIDFNSGTLSDILANGVSGNTYQQIATQTKKKAFGITYSNKTKVSTLTDTLDGDLKDQITDVISSLRGGVLEAAKVLGLEGAQSLIDAMTLNLGKLSFKDMTGEEIEEALASVFSKAADDMATTAAPFITELQKVGEGAFETLTRVAREYQVLDITLSAIGKTFGAVGVSSLKARQYLIDLAGGMDELVSMTQEFGESFLSVDERMKPVITAVYTELGKLGYGTIKTKEEFKKLVLGLDLTTEKGAETYAQLLKIAPAFSSVVDYMASLSEESDKVTDARDRLQEAYEREADAITAVKEKFEGFVETLKAFRQTLETGPSALLTPEERYKRSKSLFETTSAKALTGDEKALADLQQVGQDYLDASKDYYASSEQYFKDLEQVKNAVDQATQFAQTQVDTATQQLAALNKQVEGLLTVNQSVLSVRDAIASLASATAAQAAAQAAATQAAEAARAAAEAAALAAQQKPADPAPATTTPATATGPQTAGSYSGYVQGNADLASYYEANKSQLGMSLEQYGKFHWNHFGSNEDRSVVPFALGSAFDGGSIVKTRTQFNIGEMGEADPEAIMPLTRTSSGHLGVRAVSSRNSGGQAMDPEVKQLLTELLAAQKGAALLGVEASNRDAKKSDELNRTLQDIKRVLRNNKAA